MDLLVHFLSKRKAVQHRLRSLGSLFLIQGTFPDMNNAQATLEKNLAWLSLRSQLQKLTLKPSWTVHVNRAEPTTGTSLSTAPRPGPPISPEAAHLHQTPSCNRKLPQGCSSLNTMLEKGGKKKRTLETDFNRSHYLSKKTPWRVSLCLITSDLARHLK